MEGRERAPPFGDTPLPAPHKRRTASQEHSNYRVPDGCSAVPRGECQQQRQRPWPWWGSHTGGPQGALCGVHKRGA